MHATEAAVPEVPPTLRGKYLLEERLGEGGMAVVWRARHLLVERTVAIKMLRPEVARMPNVPQRFLQEARAAWLIDHPNVVSVLDVDVDDDGTPFIVQEILDGEDLEAHLTRQGPLSASALVALVAPVLDALAAAHARGVVHRDLKPANVFLARTARGLTPKLLDFGISRIASDDARMTSTGVVMGTPAYMAPEQIHSPKKVDARADLWAFGVMCYELLSGALPFDGETSGALLVKVCTAQPRPLREAVRGVPPALEALVMACLQRDPASRPASAASLCAALRALEAEGALEPGARGDLGTAVTAYGPRAASLGVTGEALDPRSMLPAVPANDVPANESVDRRALETRPDGTAARAALAVTAPESAPIVVETTHVAAPTRRRGAFLVASLLLLAGAAAAWFARSSTPPQGPSPRVAARPSVSRAAVSTTPALPPTPAPSAPSVAPRVGGVAPAAAPPAAPPAPPPAPPSQRARRSRHERVGAHPSPPAEAAVLSAPTVVAPTPAAPSVGPAPATPSAPSAANDRRVRYTTDY